MDEKLMYIKFLESLYKLIGRELEKRKEEFAELEAGMNAENK